MEPTEHARRDEWLTPPEAAALLRVPQDALLRAARRGEIPCLRVGKEFRFSRVTLTEATVSRLTISASAAASGSPPSGPLAPQTRPMRPGAGLPHRASAEARLRAERSRQIVKTFEEVATAEARRRRWDAEQAPRQNERAWRWVAHHRAELEALAVSHGLEFVHLAHAAHRHLRRKATVLPEAVTPQLVRLEEQRSVYGAWSAEPPPGTFPTTAAVAAGLDEEAAFHHLTPSADGLERQRLEAVVERIGDEVRATAHTDLRLGDLISVSVMKTLERRENSRRWAEWKIRGADTDNLPETLPSRITRFLRVSPTEVIEIPPDHADSEPLISYLIGGASLAEVLAGLGREDAMPDWLKLPGVPAWWAFPTPEPDAREEEEDKRLEQWSRAWMALAPIFARMDGEHSRTYERIESALTEAEAAEIRRRVCEEGQREPTIGQAFRAVWDEFIAEPGARPETDGTVGRHLCAVVAAHYGEDFSVPPWKHPEEPPPSKPRRGKGRRPAVDVEE
jgi:excisionase family DNA binding protein